MQGFSYTQLYAALQAWPLKSSALYLANLNRMIYMGELRLIRDLNLDIFDVTDSVSIAPAANSVPKPAGSFPITFTAGIAANATSATLTSTWTQPSVTKVVTFSDQEIQAVTFTNGLATVSWTLPMANAVTANAVVNSPFIVERNLWCVYSGVTRIMVKRSYDFLQSYLNASAGRPYFYADSGTGEWIFAPAADSNATAINRRYVERPVSIVIAQNTFWGDNCGDTLFAACLMEMEHFLKADDRYMDQKTKYYEELLPNTRNELLQATRAGVYAPLQPVAMVQGAAPPVPVAAPQGR